MSFIMLMSDFLSSEDAGLLPEEATTRLEGWNFQSHLPLGVEKG